MPWHAHRQAGPDAFLMNLRCRYTALDGARGAAIPSNAALHL
jgi:hypothetical protein